MAPSPTALRPFEVTDADLVASWATSAAEARMWCGTTVFPVPATTVVDRGDGVRAFVLTESSVAVGYGELWPDPAEDEVELARLIVAPAARGRGLGRVLVRALASEAATTGLASTYLRVHPENAPALACYRAAGLLPVDPADAASWNVAQPVTYVWLTLPRHVPPDPPSTG